MYPVFCCILIASLKAECKKSAHIQPLYLVIVFQICCRTVIGHKDVTVKLIRCLNQIRNWNGIKSSFSYVYPPCYHRLTSIHKKQNAPIAFLLETKIYSPYHS